MVHERDAPSDLVGRLREIDPRADVFYIGESEWLVGRWWPFNRLRYNAAGQLLENELAAPASVRRARRIELLRLFRAGLRPVLPDEGRMQGPLGYVTNEHGFGAIVEEFRRKWYGLQRAEALFNARIDVSAGVEEEKESMRVLVDRLDAERSDHSILFRGRRSIPNPRNWN